MINHLIKIFAIMTLVLVSFSAYAEEPFSQAEYPETIIGPTLFPKTTFHVYFDYQQQSNGIDSVDVFTLNPGGSISIIPGTFAISVDAWMDIFSGDASGFRFEGFGLGGVWAFYNKKPVVLSTGVDFRLVNQNFDRVGGADVFETRPFLAAGIGIMWFFLSPYVGLPMSFDINDDNDNTLFPDRNVNRWDAAHDFAMAIDYGIPLSFGLLNFLHLAIEPSGITYLRPDVRTELYLTPGIILKGGLFILRAGVKIRLYPEDSDYRRYNLVVRGGINF